MSVLHTSSILFSQIDLKWSGILPNLIFSLISTILLFRLASILFGKGFGLIVSFAWVVSIGMLTNAMLIRPYALLTTLTLGLAYLHICAFNQVCEQAQFRISTLILLALSTILGTSEHYYFLVICVGICGFFTIYLLRLGNYKLLAQYVLTEFVALLCLIRMLPNILDIFFSDLGQRTIEELGKENVSLEKIRTTFSIISQDIWNGWMQEFFIIIALTSVAVFLSLYIFRLSIAHEPCKGIVIRRVPKMELECHIPYNLIIVIALAMVALGYTLIIIKVAIWQTDRYYFCIYPFILLVMCALIYQLFKLLIKQKTIALILVLCVVCSISAMGLLTQDVNYLYTDFAEHKEILSEYNEHPIIIMSITPTKPERFIPEYAEHQNIYRCPNGSYSEIANAAKTIDLSKGFLLYIWHYDDTEEELFQKIRETYPINAYVLLTDYGGCRVFYCE